ncbi:unnamed protein product [Microthlaspi erraticum]|uniref:Exonuclease domain-containing protein n=1 Tax=Microthlaspi erraticum TaxID=1685480 RepID=A0A6D2HL59_9BRAS|nr:unnamed protein product [Microthlaspi erraticum]
MLHVIAFFDFRKTNGALQFSVKEITSDTLFEIASLAAPIRPGEDYFAKKPNSWLIDANTFEELSARIYRSLNGKVWMGHDIVKVDIPNLMAEFARINQVPPKPTHVIDAVHFTNSGTELAIAALKLGLGRKGSGSIQACEKNLEAIKRCRFMVSPLELVKVSNSDDDNMDSVVALIKYYDEKARATSRLSKLSL